MNPQNPPQAAHIRYRHLLTQRQYLKLISADLINRFGDSIDAIAFTWLVYAITGNAGWSALIFAINQLPSILVQPFAGALVEGMDKKKLMVFADIIRGITTLSLALLYIGEWLTPYMMLLFTLINSSVEAFRLPAALALVPKILEEKYYAHGKSLSASLNTLVQFIGLGAAGFIISFFGIGCAIAIDGISFFGSALILAFLKVQEKGLRKEKLRIKEYFATLKNGLIYLKNAHVVRNFCLLCVLINAVLAPLNALQSPLIYEVLGQGSGLLSVFSLAFTAGMGLGSFLYPYLHDKCPVRTQITGLGILLAFCMYGYTLGESFKSNVPAVYALTIVLSFWLGMALSLMTTTISVCFMKSVNPEYLARAGSIFNAGASAAVPAVSFAVSALTAICSVSQIFKMTALFCVIIFTGLALLRVRLEP
ncbi:MAG: MFS transporter [Roseburia sp.]|nr:MFS transporter [Roseburia sp.]